MQPALGRTARPRLRTDASARTRQSSCHGRRPATGLPRRPTTHTVGLLSSGSPRVTSLAGLEMRQLSLPDRNHHTGSSSSRTSTAGRVGRAKSPYSSTPRFQQRAVPRRPPSLGTGHGSAQDAHGRPPRRGRQPSRRGPAPPSRTLTQPPPAVLPGMTGPRKNLGRRPHYTPAAAKASGRRAGHARIRPPAPEGLAP